MTTPPRGLSKGKALAQVRRMLGPQGHVCAESGLAAVGIYGTSWRLYAVGRSWEHAVSELRRTLDPAELQAELSGKDLACWCPLDQPCHADVLLLIANQKSAGEFPAAGGPE